MAQVVSDSTLKTNRTSGTKATDGGSGSDWSRDNVSAKRPLPDADCRNLDRAGTIDTSLGGPLTAAPAAALENIEPERLCPDNRPEGVDGHRWLSAGGEDIRPPKLCDAVNRAE
jgi:hypothetical protein